MILIQITNPEHRTYVEDQMYNIFVYHSCSKEAIILIPKLCYSLTAQDGQYAFITYD